jgi:outer membrane immunogenic protein
MKSSILTLAGAAVAAGLIAAAPAQAQTFNGPVVGAQAGWSQNKIGTLEGDLGISEIDRNRDAFTGGVYAGYDHRIANVVIGVEGGFNIAASDTIVVPRGTGPVINPLIANPAGAVDAIVNPHYAFDLSARAGYVVGDKTLVYARGGYENLRARTTLIDADGSVSSKDSYDGWMVGGGVEHALGDKLSTRLEYRYSDLGGGASKFDRHQLLLGVGYHF